jgi:hypothetical protein
MSEEATHKNILAIQQYSKETRSLIRGLEAELVNSNNLVGTLTERLTVLETLLRSLQVKVYSGNATTGG